MPGRSAIRTIRRDAAVELTAAKREELLDLARRFGKGRRTYVDTYWQPKFLTAVCDPRLRIVQSQRIAGWLSPDLSAHQNKVCLESSLAILRSSWSTAFATARRVVLLDRRWDGDRDWALATLRSVGAIQECLTTPLRRSTRRQRRLRRLVLRARGTETSRRRQVLVRDRLQPVSTLLPIGGSLPRRVVGGYGYTTRTAHRRAACRIVAANVRVAYPPAGQSTECSRGGW